MRVEDRSAREARLVLQKNGFGSGQNTPETSLGGKVTETVSNNLTPLVSPA